MSDAELKPMCIFRNCAGLALYGMFSDTAPQVCAKHAAHCEEKLTTRLREQNYLLVTSRLVAPEGGRRVDGTLAADAVLGGEVVLTEHEAIRALLAVRYKQALCAEDIVTALKRAGIGFTRLAPRAPEEP